MKRLLPFLLPLIVLCADSHAAGPTIDVLTVPGIIINSYFADFDNDHKCEALIFFLDETGTIPLRKAALFTITNGRYGEQLNQVFDLDPTATCFDVGDFNGDGFLELGIITKKGVIAYQYKNGIMSLIPQPVIEMAGIFYAAPAENIVRWDFAKDIDSTHKDALVFLPIEPGFNLYKWDGKKYLLAQSLAYDHRAVVRSISTFDNYRPMGYQFYCNLPAITMADYNGDKLTDIFLTDNRLVYIYKHNYDGSFSNEPADIFGKNIQSEQERHSAQAAVSYEVFDLNNDGLADMVVTKNAWGISSYNTSIQIFRGKQMGGYNLKPNNEFTVTNGASSPYVYDLNRDGKLDLVLPSLKLGIMSNLKVLLLKSIEVNLMGFLAQGTDNYLDKPDYEKSISYEVGLSQNIDYNSILTLDGDYNGDGYNDLLVHDGNGGIKIYASLGEKLFENSPKLEFSIPRPDGINAMDLNGDGRSEAIAHYLMDYDSRKTIRIIWPRL